MYLLANGKLITRSSRTPFLADGGVVLDGDTIAAVGTTSQLREAYPDAQWIDAKGGVIMPAFVNAHTHIYSALARGLQIRGLHAETFFEILDGQWWAIDRALTLQGVRASAAALYLDCIRQGVTTVFDHHASYGAISGSLMEIAGEAKRFGVRSCLCYEVSDRDGQDKCDAAIAENAAFIDYCARERDPMLAAMFGGHALFTLSDRTLDRMAAANAGRAGFHIHVSEGMTDVYDSLGNHARRPVQRLHDHGLLGNTTILGHCIHVNPAEIELIAQTGSMVVNNPESNMGNAVGVCPVLPLTRAGVCVGLGTDAYTNDMLESAKAALCIQRHHACKPGVGWNEVTDMLLRNNPAICAKFFPKRLGVLEPGAAADVIVMDYEPYTPFSADNIDGHMLFGMTGRQCQTTIAGGRLLMLDRELVGIDEQAENAHILEAAEALWHRLNG